MSKPQTQELKEITATIEASPSNIVGALKQDLAEMMGYLQNTAALNVDPVLLKHHLEHMIKLLGAFRNMQMAVIAQAEKLAANAPEARKN